MELIVLLGPKHSGKTSVGRALAEKTGAAFYDLDGLIETQTGESPRTLYREGPAFFREAEERALKALLAALGQDPSKAGNPRASPGGAVLAAGGGIIDNPGAMALLQEADSMVLVYLEVSAETAWERIVRSAQEKGLPPFLQTEDPRKTHGELHQRRGEAYKKQAHITIDAEGKTPRVIAGEIGRALPSKTTRR
ncbi:shikimate kinase [Spirochaetia bacterium]|nr:shikimate kinase [Spirochaetia bacterium]